MGIGEDEFAISAQPVIAAQSSSFKIDNFKKALIDSNEESIFNMLFASNFQKKSFIKVPTEALFVNWHDFSTYTYRSPAMTNLGLQNNAIDEIHS